MKSPGTIYRKYKQLKKFFMLQEIHECLKRKHCNCLFGITVYYNDKNNVKRPLPICVSTLIPNKDKLQTINNIEICNNPSQCHLFSYSKNKDTIKKDIESKFSDSNYIRKNYPELYLLEWILDKDIENLKTEKKSILFHITLKIIELLNKILKYL